MMNSKALLLYVSNLLSQVEPGNMPVLLAKIEAATAPEHPTDHVFVDNPEIPNTCNGCGWIKPGTESGCSCGEDFRAHVLELPNVLIRQATTMAVTDMIISDLLGFGPGSMPSGMQVIEIDLSRRPRSKRRTDD